MDPDGKWTSTRAVLLAAAGQNCWPPAGSYMAATGQDLMAADTRDLPKSLQANRPLGGRGVAMAPFGRFACVVRQHDTNATRRGPPCPSPDSPSQRRSPL